MKWYFSVTKFSSVRDSSKIKNLHLKTNSSSTKWFLKWGNTDVLSNTSQELRCTFELADVHQCNKVDFHCCCFVCLFFTSFHSLSTATFASGINIAWGERSFAHTLGFPEEASLRDRSPDMSEPCCTFHLCVHPPYLCVNLKLAEQNNIRSLYFFLPKSTLESISYSPGCRVTRRIFPTETPRRETRQHAPAFTLK